jgi:hypothetical protein
MRNAGEPDAVLAAWVGITFAQTCLLGLWTAFSNCSVLIRFIVSVAGVAYVGLLFAICVEVVEVAIVYMLMFTFAFVPIAIVFGVARRFGIELRHPRHTASHGGTRQFTIRQIMVLTVVVACVLAVNRFSRLPMPLEEFAVILPSLAGPFIAVALAASWTIMGTDHPWRGLVVTTGLAIAAAISLNWWLMPHLDTPFWAIATLTETLTMAVTLGVLRSCGYRLRRRSTNQADPST